MVETMSEQSPKFSKRFSQKLQFVCTGQKTQFSELPPKTNSAFVVHAIPYNFSSQSLDNGPPNFNVLIEVTKDCKEAVNKMTSKSFLVPCLLSSFTFFIMGCNK